MPDLMQQWVAAMRNDRFEDAWALSEQVLRARDPATRDDPSLPYHLRWVWDGRPFDGRHVLVRCYHGLGDTIQFARFLPALGARAASLTVEVQPPLVPLLETLPGVGRIVPFDPAHPLPPAECDIEIMELAFALRMPPPAVPPPYLAVPRAALPERTIALCYGTSDWLQGRRVPAELLHPICARHSCITVVPEPTCLAVTNPAGCSSDLIETASLLASAELVITVDTMISHLAGALGRPTWLLLQAEPDWRWAPDRDRSSWYPSARLYVQPHAGAWQPVVERVQHDLIAWESATTANAADNQAGPSLDWLVEGHQPHPAAI